MKVKKQTEDKKEETTMGSSYNSDRYVAPIIEESRVETYQPPEIPQSIGTKDITPQTQIPTFFKKNPS